MAIVAVVGAQYGSEGKGVIVNEIASEFEIHVRVGGPNAGHSFYHQGRLWKMQSIPCGWTNPKALMVLGAGALINPEILFREIAELEAAGISIRGRLYIDGKASILDDRYHQQEGGIDGEIHRRIGSTGEGVGAVRHARMERDPNNQFQTYQDWKEDRQTSLFPFPADTVRLLQIWRQAGYNILLEGTQGSALSLTHGPWPYVTSADTNAATLAADCGIPPQFIRTLLVARTHPIRVAGNSGPLEGEMTWDQISEKLGRPTTEKTTVTKKTRRVGAWDDALFQKAVMLNEPSWMAVTFLDYLNPEDEGQTVWGALSPQSQLFIHRVETYAFGAPVIMAGTGGEGWKVAHRPTGRAWWTK